MPMVKLIYFEGCPNAGKARENLKAAGIRFEVVRQDDLPAGDPLRGYSSPTILRGEQAVFGVKTGTVGAGCSLEVPTPKEILAKLGASRGRPRKSGLLATIGSIASAVTVGICPVCIPAIGALMSALGLGFLAKEEVLQPLLIGFILITFGGLFWSYRKEHGEVAPLLLGVVAGGGLYVSRYFYLGSTINAVLMYASMVGLITASLWNLWLRQWAACPACVEGLMHDGTR